MSLAEEIKAAYGTAPQQATEEQPTASAGAQPTEVPAEASQTATEISEQGGNSGQSAEQSPEVVTPPVDAPAEQDLSQTPVFDWNHLSERSEGLIKDEDSFGDIIRRAREYEDLSNKLTEVEANQVKFASPFVEGLNKLYAEGANKSQIEAYYNINQIGDFSAMTPRDLLISREVLINGTDKEVAAYRIDNKFDLSQHDEGSIEYKAMLDEQRLEANKASKELEQYRNDVSTVSNPEKIQQEEQRLTEINQKAQFDNTVKEIAPIIAKEVPASFKMGTGESEKSIEYSEEFKNSIPARVQEYFKVSGTDPKDKGAQEAVNKFVEARYKLENFDAIIADIEKRTESQTTERIVKKYENPSGVIKEETNPEPTQAAISHNEWLNKKFG